MVRHYKSFLSYLTINSLMFLLESEAFLIDKKGGKKTFYINYSKYLPTKAVENISFNDLFLFLKNIAVTN